MIPGPVEISQEIIDEFNGQNVAHYGPEWKQIYLDTVERTKAFFGTNGMAFLMPGSGSLGLETAAVTFCTNKKCLLVHNGFFADRLQAVISSHSSSIEVLNFGFAQPIDLSVIENALTGNEYDVVLMVHAETSTGMLNPASDIAALAHKHEALFILDAIASGGAENIQMDVSGIDVVITSSQKGFECPAGLAIVIVGESPIANMDLDTSHSWYTDLRVWKQYYQDWYDWHPFPVTLPTNLIKAYRKSLFLLEIEGRENHFAHLKRRTQQLRNALRALGLTLLVDDGDATHGLTSVSTGSLFDSAELVTFLKQQFNIQIAGSLGAYKNSIFRIGHFSRPQVAPRNIVSTVVGIGIYLQSKGLNPNIQKAIKTLLT